MNNLPLLPLAIFCFYAPLEERTMAQSPEPPKVRAYGSHSLTPDRVRLLITPFYAAVARHDWEGVSKYMFQTAGTRPQRFVYSARLALIPDGAVWQMKRMIAVDCKLPNVQLFNPKAYLVFGEFDSTAQSPSGSGAGLGTVPKSLRDQTPAQTSPTARSFRVDLWVERGNQWVVIPDGEIPDQAIAIINLPDFSADARLYDRVDDVRELDRQNRELRQRRENAVAETIADIQKEYSTIKNPSQLEEADRVAKAKLKALGDEVNRLNAQRNKQEQAEHDKQTDRAVQNRKKIR